ncbi:hypothetical protein [Sicyoidochytrium minutum DNA virus]|nr:hypothetical protein [Sicyoidochytrium minutum DNA virus]
MFLARQTPIQEKKRKPRRATARTRMCDSPSPVMKSPRVKRVAAKAKGIKRKAQRELFPEDGDSKKVKFEQEETKEAEDTVLGKRGRKSLLLDDDDDEEVDAALRTPRSTSWGQSTDEIAPTQVFQTPEPERMVPLTQPSADLDDADLFDDEELLADVVAEKDAEKTEPKPSDIGEPELGLTDEQVADMADLNLEDVPVQDTPAEQTKANKPCSYLANIEMLFADGDAQPDDPLELPSDEDLVYGIAEPGADLLGVVPVIPMDIDPRAIILGIRDGDVPAPKSPALTPMVATMHALADSRECLQIAMSALQQRGETQRLVDIVVKLCRSFAATHRRVFNNSKVILPISLSGIIADAKKMREDERMVTPMDMLTDYVLEIFVGAEGMKAGNRLFKGVTATPEQTARLAAAVLRAFTRMHRIDNVFARDTIGRMKSEMEKAADPYTDAVAATSRQHEMIKGASGLFCDPIETAKGISYFAHERVFSCAQVPADVSVFTVFTSPVVSFLREVEAVAMGRTMGNRDEQGVFAYVGSTGLMSMLKSDPRMKKSARKVWVDGKVDSIRSEHTVRTELLREYTQELYDRVFKSALTLDAEANRNWSTFALSDVVTLSPWFTRVDDAVPVEEEMEYEF